jgi:hypothetical protein
MTGITAKRGENVNKYPKILTVFERDPKTKFMTLLEGQWACPEFEYLANCHWVFTEKVDGTNVRVHWNREKTEFAGRTDDSSLPTFLYRKLEERFYPDIMHRVFGESEDVTLYGEGFGNKIQKYGSLYIPDTCGFILFDVVIGGIWLERDSVEDIAQKLYVPIVPVIEKGTLVRAVEMVRCGFESCLGNLRAEGLVMRPEVELFDRLGARIITKIKHKDFERRNHESTP